VLGSSSPEKVARVRNDSATGQEFPAAVYTNCVEFYIQQLAFQIAPPQGHILCHYYLYALAGHFII
jgi:hypothetical protein